MKRDYYCVECGRKVTKLHNLKNPMHLIGPNHTKKKKRKKKR